MFTSALCFSLRESGYGSASRVLLGNQDGVAPDKGARHMSSRGIRMELLRIAMRTPCHQGKGSLHFAHTDGPPCDVPPSPDISHPEFCLGDVPPSPDISHPALDAGWERRTFQLSQSNMSGSSDRIFHIRMSHSRMGEEDVSTSPVRHVRIL